MFTFRQQRAADDRAAVHLILVPSWLNLEWTRCFSLYCSCYFLSPRMGGEWWKGPSVSKITLLTELHDQPPTIFLPALKPTCGSHFSRAGNRNEPGKQQICRVFSFHLPMLPNYVIGNINQQRLPWVMALYLRAWRDLVDQSWHFPIDIEKKDKQACIYKESSKLTYMKDTRHLGIYNHPEIRSWAALRF